MIFQEEIVPPTAVRSIRHPVWTPFGPASVLAAMPETHRVQIHVLDDSATRAAYEAFNRRGDVLCGDDGWGNTPFIGGCFRSVDSHHMQQDGNPKKWLYQRGIPFASEVLLLPVFRAEDDPAILTTWKMVVNYANEIFDGDNIVVADNRVRWCLYYHHDGMLTMAKEPDLSKWRW